MKNQLRFLSLVLAFFAGIHEVSAQGASFTYQGQLTSSGSPANGLYDFQFKLYIDPLGNTQVASYLTNAIPVTNGLFTTEIDFGAGLFTGSNYWLGVGVRTNNPANNLSYTALTPNQALTPTPYAIFATEASNVSGTVASSQLTGLIPSANLPASPVFSGPITSATGFVGNGANVTNVNAASLNGFQATNFWQTKGNIGTSPTNGNFVGTADNQPIELHANGLRGLRVEFGGPSAYTTAEGYTQPPSGAPNLVGGSPVNFVTPGTVGGVIGGGGATNYAGQSYTNSISEYSDFATIAGGAGNTVNGIGAFIGGGGSDGYYFFGNTAGGSASVIGGGVGNSTGNQGNEAVVGGGLFNTAVEYGSVVCGGVSNNASGLGAFIGGGGVTFDETYRPNSASGIDDVIVGGFGNTADEAFAIIGGGEVNTNSGFTAFIGGGIENFIGGNEDVIAGGYENINNGGISIIGGGENNNITAVANDSFIGSGWSNVINGTGAFIGGGGYDTFYVVGNTANGNASVVVGGIGNYTSNTYSAIGGGDYNTNTGNGATIAGGQQNIASGTYQSAVGGGYNNQATNSYATVPGGYQNTAGGQFSFAAGLRAQATNQGTFVWADSQGPVFTSTTTNQFSVRADGGVRFVTSGAGLTVDGESPLIGSTSLNGGSLTNLSASQVTSGVISTNVLPGFQGPNYETIGGGGQNSAPVQYATVAGGQANVATGVYGAIGGGQSNLVGQAYDTVAGGLDNAAIGGKSTVGGGEFNAASYLNCTVGGGESNIAKYYNDTVGGGIDNLASNLEATVGGGINNIASGANSTVPGGFQNVASGSNSFAAGAYGRATNTGSFVWSDSSTSTPFISSSNNSFNVRAAGGVDFVTSDAGMLLDGPVNLPDPISHPDVIQAVDTIGGAFSVQGSLLYFDGQENYYGGFAGPSSSPGLENTAIGFDAFSDSGAGSFNTAYGAEALSGNVAGSASTAIGYNTLPSAGNCASNIAIGCNAGDSLIKGSNNIYIANQGSTAETGITRIGTIGTQTNTFIAGISGVTVASGVGVVVNSSGQLGIATSSAKFKKDIKSMNNASDELLSLHPVTFKYKKELDPVGIPQFGLVAEEVDKIDPNLVARDDAGKIMTVRYDAVNAMLLNEFLKEHRKVEEQNTKIENLEQSLEELKKTVQELAEKK